MLLRPRSGTGELDLFIALWDRWPHYSLVSGQPLGEFSVAYFAHVLSKSTYPEHRLNPENIVLLSLEEHTLFDQQTHKARVDPQFQWLFQYQQYLKTKTNQRCP